MMSKSVILVCAIAAVLGSKLTFKDGSGTCEMVKVGNKITVVDCDLALHNSGYDSVASALDDITGHKNSYHPTEEGINSIIADIDNVKSYLEYTKVPCTTTGMTASRGVSLSPLDNKVTGDEASLSCSANGFKPSSATFGCYVDGFRGTQPTCEPYKCPAETLTWGSASLSFVETENKHANPTGYSVTKTCPISHNGAVTRECHENEETWSTSGACSEKTCPAGNFYGISFDSVTQGSTVTKTCPATHNGQITRTCTANSETWTHTGDCAEKTCAAGTFGGVAFAALTQGQSITNACPASHTGSITRQCNANSETWTHTAGSCVDVTCAAITVNIGGTNVNIDSRTQGQSHSVNCPSGYSGTVTGNCPANSNTFSTTHNCVLIPPQCGAGVFQSNVCTPTQYPFEHFTASGNDYHDLDHKTITFMPCGNNYAHETTAATSAELLQTASTGGIKMLSGDDTCHSRILSSTFTYFGQPYDSVYFCSNGYLSFRGADNGYYGYSSLSDYTESVSEFADRKYIASIWDDLDGRMSSWYHQPVHVATGMYHQRVGTVDTFTWHRITQLGHSDQNSFAVSLDSSNGKITIIHGSVPTGKLDGIVGLSDGQGISSISEVDFSTSATCPATWQR